MARPFFPFIKHIWAEGGYNHERATQATSIAVESRQEELRPDQFRRSAALLGGRALLCMDQSNPPLLSSMPPP
ncbi:hypothetical protein WKW50_25800 [Ochrobactrum sp. GPK 3]|uniref:hypothetical protein n=1 Tax=Brucella sp. 22210 TaxID=3453892 RepID=UPI0031385D87